MPETFSVPPGQDLPGADTAARQLGNQPIEQVQQACPASTAAIEQQALEIWVGGEDDKPLSGIVVELSRGASEALSDRTGPDGVVRFEQLPAGSYQLSLRELDQDAWSLLGSVALEGASDGGAGDAPWAPPAPLPPQPAPHQVQAGECIALLAEHYGFFPDTIWHFEQNSALRARRPNPYVLYAGDSAVEADVVCIPARRTRTIALDSGARYRLRRLGVPEVLRLQFLSNDRPRRHVPYLISLQTLDQAAVPDLRGMLDADGYLHCAVPPGTNQAVVTLIEHGEEHVYYVDVGYLDPLTTWSGVRAMLHNLGYDCGGEEGESGPRTALALKQFQQTHSLAPTGEADQATREKLVLRHPAG